MKKHFYIVSIILIAIIAIEISCSRNNPVTAYPIKDIPKIYPINTYNLTISEPSGIAYNSLNNTLVIVSDGFQDIYETNLVGVVLKKIVTTGADMEGIALSKNCDTIYVTEEKKKLITSFDLNGNKLSSFSVNVAVSDNNALEGVSIKKSTNELFVINEKNPRMILKFRNGIETWRRTIDYSSDISDIFYEESSNSIWLISDESRKIMKLSSTGDLLKEWEIPFEKGEGITIVNNLMYVVNDLDGKLYVFQKPN